MRVLMALLAVPTTAATKLAYSDYFFLAAIVTGILGSSTFIAGLSSATVSGSTIAGVCVLLTTIFTTVGRTLLAKGD